MFHTIKSPGAEIDLEGIWLYSFEEWNERQADRYYDQLIKGIENLKTNPKIGKSREHVREGYRSIQINHHIIYYRLDNEIIDIIRVLHESMLPAKHL